ncbi:hypothetical protein WJX75_008231 [Coccomyxa subellipsoidea]|uniref:Uncharacterized protein n=1 Tax=Coccomyxa subellipsoidea TaxID=248742 RepID=A0ABR2YZ13_9CHLO
MAHISVTDEEVKEWEPQLQQIVSWFDQLQAVDVEGVPPAVRIDMEDQNVLRPDMAVEYDDREAVLSQVPAKEGSGQDGGESPEPAQPSCEHAEQEEGAAQEKA